MSPGSISAIGCKLRLGRSAALIAVCCDCGGESCMMLRPACYNVVNLPVTLRGVMSLVDISFAMRAPYD